MEKINKLEGNLKRAKEQATVTRKPHIVESTDNGKTWKTKEVNGVYRKLVMPGRKKR